jgi:hypothetical protein
MEHRLVERGQSTLRLVDVTSFYAGLALSPLALSLGLSVYVMIARHFGAAAGAAIGIALSGLEGRPLTDSDHETIRVRNAIKAAA